MKIISKKLKKHYEKTFLKFGPNAHGVDWGDEKSSFLRQSKMLAVIKPDINFTPSLLDVGCGYGGLLAYSLKHKINIDYTGIDLVESMVKHAKNYFVKSDFIQGDIHSHIFKNKFDYVVCNGILTQKLSTEIKKMDKYAKDLITKMFDLCIHGIAFNIMSNKVNFMADNLYYRSPVEMISFCLDELSHNIKLDHAYPLYEYTIYVYKDKQ